MNTSKNTSYIITTQNFSLLNTIDSSDEFVSPPGNSVRVKDNTVVASFTRNGTSYIFVVVGPFL